MSKVRYYFELNPSVVDHFGGYQYITALAEEPLSGHLPRFGSYGPHNSYKLMASSDRVIVCDSNGPRYVKHRGRDPRMVSVDPDEFTLIKMKSVEFG